MNQSSTTQHLIDKEMIEYRKPLEFGQYWIEVTAPLAYMDPRHRYQLATYSPHSNRFSINKGAAGAGYVGPKSVRVMCRVSRRKLIEELRQQNMKYYKSLNTGSIYKTETTTFSDGTPTLTVQRWNWDFENWNGHIHDHDLTRDRIKEGLIIVPITEEETAKLINTGIQWKKRLNLDRAPD